MTEGLAKMSRRRSIWQRKKGLLRANSRYLVGTKEKTLLKDYPPIAVILLINRVIKTVVAIMQK